MGKPILPEVLREKIKELLQKGYTRDAVSKFVESEAKIYVKTSEQAMGVRPTQLTIKGKQ